MINCYIIPPNTRAILYSFDCHCYGPNNEESRDKNKSNQISLPRNMASPTPHSCTWFEIGNFFGKVKCKLKQEYAIFWLLMGYHQRKL